MRSRSLVRIGMVSLGVSLVLTLGCDRPPLAGPSKLNQEVVSLRLSSMSISPTHGASMGATVVTIRGVEFQSGTTVTVDGARVDATVLDANTISLMMPAHAAGKVDVTVIRARGRTPASVTGGYTYVSPPVIGDLRPNIGSTAGGTPVAIIGPGMCCTALTVTIDGIVNTNVESGWPGDEIYFSTPAHTAGPVEVIVTDEYGQTASTTFTYASPDTFDVNGDWQGAAEDYVLWDFRRLQFTIRNNLVVSVSCDNAPSVALDPSPVVANGEFSFVGSDGDSISGRILSPHSASGSINMGACRSRPWGAEKQ